MVENPELVGSLFIYETSSATHVGDPSALKTVREEGAKTFGSAVKAVKENDKDDALRQLINGVGGREDYFAAQPDRLTAAWPPAAAIGRGPMHMAQASNHLPESNADRSDA